MSNLDKIFQNSLASTHQDISRISDGVKKEQELDFKVYKHTRAKMIVSIFKFHPKVMQTDR